MDRTDEIDRAMADAIDILDGALGYRMCGAVVSGNTVPGFRGIANNESPFNLTNRAMVAPLLEIIGYGVPEHELDSICDRQGTITAMVPMNRPVNDPLRQIMSFMRGHGTERGIATDGFFWALAEIGPLGPRVGRCIDLRPLYIDALDRSRFKVEIEFNVACAEAFIRTFGRENPSGRRPSTPASRPTRRS